MTLKKKMVAHATFLKSKVAQLTKRLATTDVVSSQWVSNKFRRWQLKIFFFTRKKGAEMTKILFCSLVKQNACFLGRKKLNACF